MHRVLLEGGTPPGSIWTAAGSAHTIRRFAPLVGVRSSRATLPGRPSSSEAQSPEPSGQDGAVKIYTRKGDDGTTGLLFGGRVRKDSPLPVAYGTVDEAQAALGVARADAEAGSELDEILIGIERDLWVLMAELATDPSNRHKLTAGKNLVTPAMVDALEGLIDATDAKFEPPKEFVVPGQNRVAAALDVARTVVRRAERAALVAAADGSSVVAYLNRLSDACWTLARWRESVVTEAGGAGSLPARGG